MALIFLCIYLQQKFQPYQTPELNKLEIIALIASGTTIYCGLYYMAGDLSDGAELVFFLFIVFATAWFVITWGFKTFLVYQQNYIKQFLGSKPLLVFKLQEKLRNKWCKLWAKNIEKAIKFQFLDNVDDIVSDVADFVEKNDLIQRKSQDEKKEEIIQKQDAQSSQKPDILQESQYNQAKISTTQQPIQILITLQEDSQLQNNNDIRNNNDYEHSQQSDLYLDLDQENDITNINNIHHWPYQGFQGLRTQNNSLLEDKTTDKIQDEISDFR